MEMERCQSCGEVIHGPLIINARPGKRQPRLDDEDWERCPNCMARRLEPERVKLFDPEPEK